LFKGTTKGVPIFGRRSPTIFVLLDKSKRLFLEARRLRTACGAEFVSVYIEIRIL
jgi:hypothetical protein